MSAVGHAIFLTLGKMAMSVSLGGQAGENEIHPMVIIVNPVVCGLQSLGILGRQ